jgi:metal-responsive CopG/Arc/MetJ family transcriptional regulator
MAPYKNSTEWKMATGRKSINLNLPYALCNELDNHTRITATNRTETIKNAIRYYLRKVKDELVEAERMELDAYHIQQQNQRRKANTGLLPDF